MYFFLLACSLWGVLLLFRRSRYKGHAKYKYNTIQYITIIIIIIIIILLHFSRKFQNQNDTKQCYTR